jgi:deoxyribodipyrimidine photo-lyase
MIVASFLCKHLLIDWRWGEAYFAEKLLDFDLASNNGGWQWAAGSGCDAAPYFRIFSPKLQTEKFDKSLSYIKKWVPELKAVPVDLIAEPQKMSKMLQRQVGCVIGKNYPAPIVDHATAYQEAKKRIFSWRSQKEVREASKQVYLKHGSRKKRKENRSKTQKN